MVLKEPSRSPNSRRSRRTPHIVNRKLTRRHHTASSPQGAKAALLSNQLYSRRLSCKWQTHPKCGCPAVFRRPVAPSATTLIRRDCRTSFSHRPGFENAGTPRAARTSNSPALLSHCLSPARNKFRSPGTQGSSSRTQPS